MSLRKWPWPRRPGLGLGLDDPGLGLDDPGLELFQVLGLEI